MTYRDPAPQRVLVLHPHLTSKSRSRDPSSALDEAVSLARALPGLEVADGFVIRISNPHPGLLFGKGRLADLRSMIETSNIDLLIVDGDVTPVQQRNLETELKVKLLDRTGLIIEIFGDRAVTREGKLQVEMAALSYQRTRLVRAWTHLERQRGGLGFVGGPGETQIEADRRAIDEQLVRLRRQLQKIVKTRHLHRKSRKKAPFPAIVLVGYTNAGKSTLFNRMTGSSVMAKDLLFATLDPVMRKIRLPAADMEIILSDTVGFIDDLPTELVAAFQATLEEVTTADLIVHVRDISHPETDRQAEDVHDVLHDLGVKGDMPVIEVWNKSDKLKNDSYQVFKNLARRKGNVVLMSALSDNIPVELLDVLKENIARNSYRDNLKLGYEDGDKRAWLIRRGLVESESHSENGFTIAVRWNRMQEAQFFNL